MREIGRQTHMLTDDKTYSSALFEAKSSIHRNIALSPVDTIVEIAVKDARLPVTQRVVDSAPQATASGCCVL